MIAFGSALPAVEPGLDPPDRAPVGFLGPSFLVQERRELGIELAPEPLLVVGRRRDHRVGGLERARRPRGTELQSVRGHVAEREPVVIHRHPSGAAEVPAGQPRGEPCAGRRDPLGLELLDHEGLAERREGDDVAPAPDRLGQLVRPRGKQQEDGIGGRLLQDLQQRVGGRRRQPVGLADQEDLPARLRRGQVGGMPHLIADRIHVDVPSLRFDHELVRMLIAEREPAVTALPASAVRTQEGSGEGPSGERLPGAFGAGEDIGVVRAFGRTAEERHGGVLAGHLFQNDRHLTKTNDGRGREDHRGISSTGGGHPARGPRARAPRGPNRTPSPDRGWRPPPRTVPDVPPRS